MEPAHTGALWRVTRLAKGRFNVFIAVAVDAVSAITQVSDGVDPVGGDQWRAVRVASQFVEVAEIDLSATADDNLIWTGV